MSAAAPHLAALIGPHTATNTAGELIDLVAVERAITGALPRPALTHAERLHAVRLMRTRDVPLTHMAKRLGVGAYHLNLLLEEAQQ